jgi:hypothetical protein
MPSEHSREKPSGTLPQFLSFQAHALRRTLVLESPIRGPIDLNEVIENHIQGITRVDDEGGATLIVSLSGSRHGALWFARFDLVPDKQRPGRRCLARRGRTVAALRTTTAHPGGIQASGDLLAVAAEADKGWARIDIYDIADPTAPTLVDTLPLDDSHGGGVFQVSDSKAGFVAFSAVGPDEYFLFIGGRSYAKKQGWFFRYTPREATRWHFEGPFTGNPISSTANAWGPQNGAAMVRGSCDPEPYLLTFGSKGSDGFDAFRTRLRCFTMDRSSGPTRLVQEPTQHPRTLAFGADAFSKLGPNQRWGASAFVDAQGLLHMYFTARNARPRGLDAVHDLEIAELSTWPEDVA